MTIGPATAEIQNAYMQVKHLHLFTVGKFTHSGDMHLQSQCHKKQDEAASAEMHVGDASEQNFPSSVVCRDPKCISASQGNFSSRLEISSF